MAAPLARGRLLFFNSKKDGVGRGFLPRAPIHRYPPVGTAFLRRPSRRSQAMKEEFEEEKEITEEESQQVDAGARARRMSTGDVHQTRRRDGTGGTIERTIRTIEPI
jgi:hypothetical protein